MKPLFSGLPTHPQKDEHTWEHALLWGHTQTWGQGTCAAEGPGG